MSKRVLTWSALLLLTAAPVLAASPTNLLGSLRIHDPSTVVKCNGRYYIFGTGRGIMSKSSVDKNYWVAGPRVFTNPPSWTSNAVPGFTGHFWAPDVIYFNGLYHLYYAVSTWGRQVSAIGLATNPTLDSTDPAYLWTDRGPVIQSTNGLAYNCIDPSFTFDTASNLWMSFGSYWTGIYLAQLDATIGLLTTNHSLTHLAYNSSIEASYLYHHGNYYYLFVNWGRCCAGVKSTYNIRVGRSSSITGPYYDRAGTDMISGGGTLFLGTTGKFIGPGQIGILNDNGSLYFSCHYYDGEADGTPTLDLQPLSWTPDGWPTFTR